MSSLNSLGTSTPGSCILVDGHAGFPYNFWNHPRTSVPHMQVNGHPRITPAIFRPHMWVHGPLQLPIPHPYFPKCRCSLEFPQCPGCSASCWASPHKPMSPVFAQLQDQRKGSWEGDWAINGSMSGGLTRLNQVLERHPKVCGRWRAGQTGSLCSLEEGEGPGGIDIRWAHQLPGKPAESHALHHHIDNRWRCFDLKVRAITTWGGGSYLGRSVLWVGTGGAGTGGAGDGQTARGQPCWVAWPHRDHGGQITSNFKITSSKF